MKLKILIWGFGNRGKNLAKKIEKEYDYLELIGFGDNDTEKIGNQYGNVAVYGIEEVERNQKNIDCVIISIPKEEDLYQQLIKKLVIPIYRDLLELTNKRFSIDITGWCNAKCKWCYTGRKNYIGESLKKKYMQYGDFVKVHQHLVNCGIMHYFQEVMLYSWGEPFLNPDYLRILDYLAYKKQVFSISTNASYPQYTNNNKAYENCKTVVFSLSGITNESYKRIHGFDIEIIKKNIRKIIDNIRQNGFQGEAKLSFHVYKFNQNELEKAKRFAEELELQFEPIPAYLNGMHMRKKYLCGEMSNGEIREVEEELILSHIVGHINERPINYCCPLQNILSIDSDGNLELCCCSDAEMDDVQWGSIFNIKNLEQWQKYRAEMLKSETCQKCREYGIDYWVCNNPKYEVLDR